MENYTRDLGYMTQPEIRDFLKVEREIGIRDILE